MLFNNEKRQAKKTEKEAKKQEKIAKLEAQIANSNAKYDAEIAKNRAEIKKIDEKIAEIDAHNKKVWNETMADIKEIRQKGKQERLKIVNDAINEGRERRGN